MQSDDITDNVVSLPTWQPLHGWIRGICVVGFDLELGQTMERVAPPTVVFSPSDLKSICYHAFPDSNSGCQGDSEFFFRIAVSAPVDARPATVARAAAGAADPVLAAHTGAVPIAETTRVTLGLPLPDQQLYGCVYFRQVPDVTLKRGFFQKSIVLLTAHPFPALFASITRVVARAYFRDGPAALDAACLDMRAWPAVAPDAAFPLPLLDVTFQVAVPGPASAHAATLEVPAPPAYQASLRARDLAATLAPCLSRVQLLWELMLTCEPVVVAGLSPAATSRAVLGLVSLIAPLSYCGDQRPFFTIHEPDCVQFTRESIAPPSAIVGVSNPHFERVLRHWPTIVRLPRLASEPAGHKYTRQDQTGGTGGAGPGFALPAGASARRAVSPSKFTFGSQARSSNSSGGGSGSSSNVVLHEVVASVARRLLDEDRSFLRRVSSTSTISVEQASTEIYAHFFTLTQQFLLPLERYAARLMPLKHDVCPPRPPPVMAEFNPRDFLHSLGDQQKSLPRKGDWLLLYGRFVKSPNFRGWLHAKVKSTNSELLRLYMARVCEERWLRDIASFSELRLVDLLVSVRESLRIVTRRNLIDADAVATVRLRLASITALLPSDTQASLGMGRVEPAV